MKKHQVSVRHKRHSRSSCDITQLYNFMTPIVEFFFQWSWVLKFQLCWFNAVFQINFQGYLDFFLLHVQYISSLFYHNAVLFTLPFFCVSFFLHIKGLILGFLGKSCSTQAKIKNKFVSPNRPTENFLLEICCHFFYFFPVSLKIRFAENSVF